MSYLETDTTQQTRRVIAFVVVLVFQGALVWALKNGLADALVDVIKGPIETKIIADSQDDKNEPPPPPPKFDKPPPVFVPTPEFAVDAPAETATTSAISNAPPKVAEAPPPPKPVTLPRANPRRPNAQPEYPPTSRRLEEVGTVVLALYVLEDGKVGEAKVDKTSGFDRLDEAAVKEALRTWRFIPGTSDGKPSAMWHKVQVTFKLEN